jgi:hypothetical protein
VYLLALFVPPLAVLLAGKPFQALVNGVLYGVAVVLLVLTIAFGGVGGWPFWLLAAAHAVLVVNGHKADERTKRVLIATRAAGQSATVAMESASTPARPARPVSVIPPDKRPKLPCARCGQHVRAVAKNGALACPYCGGQVGS